MLTGDYKARRNSAPLVKNHVPVEELLFPSAAWQLKVTKEPDVNSKGTVTSVVFTYVCHTPRTVPGTGQTLKYVLNA